MTSESKTPNVLEEIGNALSSAISGLLPPYTNEPLDEGCAVKKGAVPGQKRETYPCWFLLERVREVVELYCTGMAIDDISHWVGLSSDEVNMVLDHYAPHLDGM